MKKTKLLISLVATVLALSACGEKKERNSERNTETNTQQTNTENNHSHTFGTEWVKDPIYHWHAATCEHKNEVSDKAQHIYGDWRVVTDATVLNSGIKSRTCTVCGYEQLDNFKSYSSEGSSIDKALTINQLITYSSSMKYYSFSDNEVFVEGILDNATISSGGGYEIVFAENYDTTKAIFRVSHCLLEPAYAYSDGINNHLANKKIVVRGYIQKNVLNDGRLQLLMDKVDASQLSSGVESYPYLVYADVTNPVSHEHTYSQVWSYDDYYHWHAATCEHTDLVNDKELHTYSDWVVETNHSSSNYGKEVRACSKCGYTQTRTISTTNRDGLTKETALNPIEFADVCKALSSTATSTSEIYVKGKAKNVSYNTSYKSYSFDFEEYSDADGGTVYIYSAILDSTFGTTELAAADLEGKYVTVYGYYKQYRSGTNPVKYEICYLSAANSPTGSATSPKIVAVDETSNDHIHSFSDWNIVAEATETADGLRIRTCSSCGYVEEERIPKTQRNKNGTFTVYTFNDFHGAVNEYSSQSHIGLAKFGTYLKNVSKNDNTLIIDSGDTYQGSIESNYNYGNMITDVFNYAHVDVHTLGNHDFDWGIDKIKINKAKKANDGWSMTNLAANIYDYDFDNKIEGNVQQTELGDKYYIKTLNNGLKIGVDGVIGSGQITDICTPLVKTVCFKDHIQVLKNLSDELRTQKSCDVVIASLHEGAQKSMNKGLTDVSSISNKKYFDYVACAHEHKDENYTENGVYFTQASAYGEKIYKAEFSILNGNVTNCNVTRLNYSYIVNSVSTIDPKISSIIDSYAAEYSSVGGQVLTNSASGTFEQSNQMPNLLCKAMYTEAYKEGYNVDVAITNKARYDVSGSTIKYSSIYEAFPFDNVIYIAKIKGSKNVQQVFNFNGYNYIYHNSSLTNVNENTWYTVAVIDFLLYHTNSSRYYDYFSHSSSYMQVIGTLKKSNGDNYVYRDICADYIKGHSGTLNASDFDKDNAEFSSPSFS